MKATLLYFLVFTAIATMRAQQYGRVIYASPDKKLAAVITPTYTQERGFNEHRIEIRSASGEHIATKDHSSSDHEHGYGVIFAAWTPDSRFFVYSVSSSGGHSAWHFPTYVFARDRGRFFALDDIIEHPFTTPQFVLFSPNEFRSERLSPEGYGHPNVPVVLKLQDVEWPKSK